MNRRRGFAYPLQFDVVVAILQQQPLIDATWHCVHTRCTVISCLRTILDQPLLEMLVLLLGLDAGEGDGAAERVAELGGAEPVELEVSVKVAAASDLVEGDRARAVLVERVVQL